VTDDAKQEREGVLLPCPFCGGEASANGVTRYVKGGADAKWNDGSEVREAFFVSCVKCGGNRRNVVGGQQTKELAIAAWNTRQPQTDALELEIKRLREIVYRYVDPFDVVPEDEDFVQAAQRAALKKSK